MQLRALVINFGSFGFDALTSAFTCEDPSLSVAYLPRWNPEINNVYVILLFITAANYDIYCMLLIFVW